MNPMELKQLRRSYSLTQQSLADRLDVRQQTVARWETGKQQISRLAQLAIYHVTRCWWTRDKDGTRRVQRRFNYDRNRKEPQKRSKARKTFAA